MSGCVQLYHPSYLNHYIVVEQKLGIDKDFIPLDEGAYVFFIRPNKEYAQKEELFNFQQVVEFLEFCTEEDGWKLDEEMSIDIPKYTYVKWQICSKLR